MKPDIHPQYYPQAKVVCASCGNKFEVGSTQAEIHTEICSNCHPFYTGKQVLIDTAGRVERFQRIVKKASEKKAAVAAHKVAKAKRAADDKTTATKSDVKAVSAKSGAKTTLKKIRSNITTPRHPTGQAYPSSPFAKASGDRLKRRGTEK